jgi:hypothetical protein
MRSHFSPATVMAALALCISVGFSSLPAAVAQTASSAAAKAGIVKRSRTADNAKKLGGLKPIKAANKAVGTKKAKNHLLALDSKGKIPISALPTTTGPGGAKYVVVSGQKGDPGAPGTPGPKGASGTPGQQGIQGLLGEQGPAGAVTGLVVRTAQSALGGLLGSNTSATAVCDAGEKLVGGTGFVGTSILSPITNLLGLTNGIFGFISTAAGAPVPDGTSDALAYTVQGVATSTTHVVAQAFCAS